jgi:GT2 family glycosyltransferase
MTTGTESGLAMSSPATEVVPTSVADIAVVIVNWNARQEVVDCLMSLRSNPPSVPWEAVVVDNGSTDGSLGAIRQATPWARIIANGTNLGLAAANNQGIRATRADAVLISNPDVVYREGAVDALVDVMRRRPRAAFVAPKLLYEDGELQASAGDLPTLTQALLGRQVQRRRDARRSDGGGLWWVGWDHSEERRVGRAAECAYLVRRSAMGSIGLQDERFPLDWEGIDWSARARDGGWEIWFSPDAEVVHLGGRSIRKRQLHWVVSSHRGMYRYFSKRSPRGAHPLLAGVVGLRAATKLGLLLSGQPLYERAHRAPEDQVADPETA